MIHSIKKQFYNKNKNLFKNKWILKLILFIILNLIFSLIYLVIPDYELGGINTLQTFLENEILSNKALKILKNKKKNNIISEELNKFNITQKMKNNNKKESFQNINLKSQNNNTNLLDLDNKIINKYINEEPKSQHYDDLLSIQADKVRDYVSRNRLSGNNIYPSIYQKWFDRFYFSIVTGTTLGFGDIYPISTKTKLLVIIQLFFVYALIVF